MKPPYIYNDGICQYKITQMPGCDAVAIFHGVAIYPNHRNQGHGKLYHQKRLDKARELGYRIALCTVRLDNTAQMKIMQHFRWKTGRTFLRLTNEKDVVLFYKDLYDPYDCFGGI